MLRRRASLTTLGGLLRVRNARISCRALSCCKVRSGLDFVDCWLVTVDWFCTCVNIVYRTPYLSCVGAYIQIEIYRNEPSRRRECLYYLAVGQYKMGNYEEAKRFNGTFFLLLLLVKSSWRRIYIARCGWYRYMTFTLHDGFGTNEELLLEKEPTNLQAQSLASQIDEKMTRGVCFVVFLPPPPSLSLLLVHSLLFFSFSFYISMINSWWDWVEGYIGLGLVAGRCGCWHYPFSNFDTASKPRLVVFFVHVAHSILLASLFLMSFNISPYPYPTTLSHRVRLSIFDHSYYGESLPLLSLMLAYTPPFIRKTTIYKLHEYSFFHNESRWTKTKNKTLRGQ